MMDKTFLARPCRIGNFFIQKGSGLLLLSLDELLGPGDVLIPQELCVFNANVVVDVVEISGVLAWHGIFGEGAGQSQLVEDGLVAAEERVVQSFLVAVGVGDGVADVEDLAVVVDVSVVSVSEAVTIEIGVDWSNDQLDSVGKKECLSLHPGQSDGNS